MRRFMDLFKDKNLTVLVSAFLLASVIRYVIISLVEDIIGPVVGMIFGGKELFDLYFSIGNYDNNPSDLEITVDYGIFIQSLLELVIAFYVVKYINKPTDKGASEKSSE